MGQAAASLAQPSVSLLPTPEAKKEANTFLVLGRQDFEENLAVSDQQPAAESYDTEHGFDAELTPLLTPESKKEADTFLVQGRQDPEDAEVGKSAAGAEDSDLESY